MLNRPGYLAAARMPNLVEAMERGLRELGYIEGKNLKIEYRFDGQKLGLDTLASELVQLGLDTIVAVGTPAAFAAKRATTTIPIVMAPVGDPVRYGIISSIAHPGGNITGVTLYGSELSGKRVELFKEALPDITRLAVLCNGSNPLSQYAWEDAQAAARQLGTEALLFMVREPDELAGAFAAMHRSGAEAVVVLPDSMFYTARQQISVLAAEHHLPAMYEGHEYVEDGGLISYGPNIVEIARRSALLVDKVLKGAKPADLPVEQPTKFELAINLKTAKALGLTVPATLLARADEVIE
jgi:putative ABC transport system substrate-binding protein